MIRPKKIILAEDNPADAQLTQMAFSDLPLSLELVHVNNGQELMDFLNTEPLDNIALILLDLNMPKKGGIEVLKECYEDEELRKLPIVVLSSSGASADINTCYMNGANAYVQKPIDIDQFNNTISSIANFWTTINVLPTFAISSNV